MQLHGLSRSFEYAAVRDEPGVQHEALAILSRFRAHPDMSASALVLLAGLSS